MIFVKIKKHLNQELIPLKNNIIYFARVDYKNGGQIQLNLGCRNTPFIHSNIIKSINY